MRGYDYVIRKRGAMAKKKQHENQAGAGRDMEGSAIQMRRQKIMHGIQVRDETTQEVLYKYASRSSSKWGHYPCNKADAPKWDWLTSS